MSTDNASTPSPLRFLAPVLALALAAGALVYGYARYAQAPLLTIHHAPDVYAVRHGHFTANINGVVSRVATGARYRVNDGPWRPVRQEPPRAQPPVFIIELAHEDMREGENTITIETTARARAPQVDTHSFRYDPSPVALPFVARWEGVEARQLDSQDGLWETFETEHGWRVRPVPGSEDYDRILNITGAFEGARRVETDVVFRETRSGGRFYGFGLLGMWGGRPDLPGYEPRRGWNIAIQWYYSRYEGVGAEFSIRTAGEPPHYTLAYIDYPRVPGVRYHIVAEMWPVDEGEHGPRFRQRLKWWPEGEPEPEAWIETADVPGSPLPREPYAVALIIHRCQVDFGPVRVLPLDPATLSR